VKDDPGFADVETPRTEAGTRSGRVSRQLTSQVRVGATLDDGALGSVLEVVDLAVLGDPVDQGKGLMLMARMFAADGGKALTSEIEKGGEPWRPELGPLRAAKEIGAYDMWNLHKERDEFLNKYHDRWTETGGIDAILCPVMPSNAIENGKFQHSTCS
jgi:hypothetical protein